MDTLSDEIEYHSDRFDGSESFNYLRIKRVKEFIKKLLLHTDYEMPELGGEGIIEPKFNDKQVNEIIQEWKDSMSDTIRRLAGDKLI